MAFGLFKGKKSDKIKTDFSDIDSNEKAIELFNKRQLARVYLMPLDFGGQDVPMNCLFVPDFVVELNDGRLLVVEYKGDMLVTNDDSREKNAVGECWANRSKGKCLFIMAVAEDSKGRNVFQQIDHVIKRL